MTTLQEPAVEQHYLSSAVSEHGGLPASTLEHIGEHKGFYKELAMLGSLTADELARLTRANERHVRDWLARQAAAGRITYSPGTCRYALSQEKASVLRRRGWG